MQSEFSQNYLKNSYRHSLTRLSLNANSVEDDSKTSTETRTITTPDGKTTTTVTTTKTMETGKPVTSKAFTGEDSHPVKHTEETNKAKMAPTKHTEEETTKTKPPPVKSEGKSDAGEEAHNHPSRADPASKCSPIVMGGGEFKEHLDLIGHDFSKVDSYARATPAHETHSIAQLSKYLTSRWNNPLDKLRSIFVWIAENISYDTDAFFSGNLKHCSAEETLKLRKGVCDGFAEVFTELATHAGLKVWKIKGKAKGVHYKPGDDIDKREYAHAWNGTIYKGEYLLIDSTWGAGHLTRNKFEKRFEPFYFLTRPTSFIFTHIPDDPREQYLSPPLTREEFLNLNNVKPPFFAAGMEFREYLGHSITTNDDLIEFEIARYHPDEGQPLHAVLEWNGKEVEVLIQRVVGYDASAGKVYKLQTACPSRGEGKLDIYVMFEGNKGPLAACFKVVNKGSGKNYSPFVKTFRVPFTFTIQKPTHLNLKLNKEYKFEFAIFDLKDEQHHEFSLFSPEKNIRKLHKVSRCEDGSITYGLDTKVDQKGNWKLVFSKDGKHFDFIAEYHVD
ncbi:14986_t:CDS:2 [Cetraspora pellucida]|uniref:14986_t:CDS:1 n=1 Tax=Cetraspora pellucida TaxID=1433469 RepID=A0A9N9CKW8_9GLOM|nr:14986_t:CDS:2 [Cetraspora pellucida]